MIYAILFAVAIAACPQTFGADGSTRTVEHERMSDAGRKSGIVSVWRADESKGRQTHWTLPDAAFVGNGDLGLVNGDAPGGKSFWICKGDFISGGHFFTKKKGEASEFEDPGMSATVGPFALRIEGVGTPEDTLSIATADLTSVFPRTDGGKVTVRTYVAKTANVIVSEIRGADGLTVEAGGALVETNGYACANGVLPNGDRYTWRRTPNTSGGKAGSWRSECALVTRQIRNAGVLFVVTAAYTADKAFNEKDERVGADAVREAEKLLESTLATGLGKLRSDHEKWWWDYWGRSSVTLGDEELERFYYGSLYVLAVAAPYGYSKVTPGLYGSMVTEDLNGWHNDFHLNYNFISPFYGVCAANRPDFIKALLKPIIEYLPDAKRNAVDQLSLIKADYVAKRPDLAHGIPGGALYPVALLQGGMSRWTRPEHYLEQVMNAPMTAAFFCTYWEYTHDEEFWHEAYPFLEATARFFVGWCEKEPLEGGGYRYSFYDSLGEDEGFCKNCSCTLEFVRHLFNTLAMRETDAAKRTLWRDCADHLAAWPRTTFTVGGFSKPILSLGESEKPELMIRGAGAVELEGVQPGEAFSFDVDAETRTRAINTVDAMIAKCGSEKVWTNINQTPKLFVTGIKIGYPAEKIIAAFKEHQLRRIGRKNFTLHCGAHGIEKSGAIEFINAMLLQSDHGYVKLFPNWTGWDASFRKLRAKGGFLVSAELKDGKVRGVEVESIFGGTFRMVDPNPFAALPSGWRRGKTRHSGEVTLERDLALGEKVTIADESRLSGQSSVSPSSFEDWIVRGEEVVPVSVSVNDAGNTVVDFGKHGCGWIEVDVERAGEYFFIWGELLNEKGAVETNELFTVREGRIRCAVTKGRFEEQGKSVRIPYVKGNGSAFRDGAVGKFGVVMPFRWLEVVKSPFPVTRANVRQVPVYYPYDMTEEAFSCDDANLVAVHDFCKHSIRATTYTGKFIDGDRERLPYEADSYITLLGTAAVTSDDTLSHAMVDYLATHTTWPTEWKQFFIRLVHEDWMRSGRTDLVRKHYRLMRDAKSWRHLRRADGLIVTRGPKAVAGPSGEKPQDIVDWGRCYRDGFVFCDVNAVVNALHYRNLIELAEMARAIGEVTDAAMFEAEARATFDAYQKAFFDSAADCYCDGEGTSHHTVQANAMALACGVVPKTKIAGVADYVSGKGFSCSTYMAQFVLEALFKAERADRAFELMTSDGHRSWRGMMAKGATITMEFWDLTLKEPGRVPDMNHAWSTAPLNMISRYVLGVTPSSPGWASASIRPNPGPLTRLSGRIPTPKGVIALQMEKVGGKWSVTVETPVPVTFVLGNEKRELSVGRTVVL